MVAAPIADELQREPSTRATMRIASNRKVRYEEIVYEEIVYEEIVYEEIVFVLILRGCG